MSEVAIRPLVAQDAPQLFNLVHGNRAQLDSAKFWWVHETQNVADSQRFIERAQATEAGNGAPTRGICIDEELAGITSLHPIDWENRRALMGYWLDRRHSGRGHATEAVRMLIDETFSTLDVEELRISAWMTNQASLSIARRLGFSLLEVTREPLWRADEVLADTAIYGLQRDDFAASRSPVPC